MQIEPFSRALCLGAALLLNGCASVAVWENDESYEVRQGEERHKAILERTPAYDNEKIARYVSTIGNKIAAASDRPSLKWHFTVLDSAVENAFATTGGYVYITRGLLAYLRSESDLAAVLAHEVAHICNRDSQRRSVRENVALLGMVLVVPEVLLAPQIGLAPLGMGLSAVRRKEEVAADQSGAAYLERAGYAPEAMHNVLDVIERIAAYQKRTKSGQGWWHRAFAQHPTNEKRQTLLASSSTGADKAGPTVPEADFLQVLEGMEIGESRFRGIAHRGRHYFPDWQINLELPKGWRAHTFAGFGADLPAIWLTSDKFDGRLIIHRRDVSDRSKVGCEAIENYFGYATLSDVAPLRQDRPDSCVATAKRTLSGLFTKSEFRERVGIVRLNDYYLTFRGFMFSRKDEERTGELEQVFVTIARSIEPVVGRMPDPPRLRIHRAREGDSLAGLAAGYPTDDDAVEFLRALNVKAPEEDVVPKELVKVVR